MNGESRHPLIFLVLLFALLAPARAEQEQIIRDDRGRPFVLPESPPIRIISLTPNITEILFALGRGGNIVGVTRFCDFPPEARRIREVGGLVDPNIEIILSLKPDLIIAFRGNPLRVLDRLQDLGFPVFVLDIGDDLESLFSLLSTIGMITRSEKEATRLSVSLKDQMSAIVAKLGEIEEKRRAFVLLHSQGLWTCGGESYLNDILAKAGITNIAASVPKKWFLYNRERLIRDNPEVIIVMAKSEADFEKARFWLTSQAHLDDVAAVKSGEIVPLDEDAASRFGPRLIKVLEHLARTLHPEKFGEGQ